MDWDKLFDGATTVATAAIPLTGGAAVPIAAGIIIARKAADLVDTIVAQGGVRPPEELLAARAELDRVMNQNVDAAIVALNPAQEG